MTYTVFISSSAARQIKKFPPNVQQAIFSLLTSLQDNPRPKGSIKLSGLDEYRIRIGYNYRIRYTIQDDKLLVEIVKVGHRREIYRK